jgi:hypothetical protein
VRTVHPGGCRKKGGREIVFHVYKERETTLKVKQTASNVLWVDFQRMLVLIVLVVYWQVLGNTHPMVLENYLPQMGLEVLIVQTMTTQDLPQDVRQWRCARQESMAQEWKEKMGVQSHPQECVSVVQLDGILRMVYKNVTNACLASLRNQSILLVVQVVQSDFMVVQKEMK